MDIFNKQKLQELQKENKEIKKLLVDLNKKLIQLEANSEQWDDYQKWKELKNSFPKIEEMFKIKDLKRLVDRRNYLNNVLEETHKQRLIKQVRLSELKGTMARGTVVRSMNDLMWLIKEVGTMIENTEPQINKILKEIGKNKDIKLIEILKLYGIESDWILEK
tara:strand:+ start:231 stop:719 length:489 start_codon:yes stop_codon:yes gene_type:complete